MPKPEKVTEKDKMKPKKEMAVKHYASTYGNVTQTCTLTGIARNTYYDWLKEDPKFKQAIDDVQPEERLIDFTENKHLKNIEKGDVASIIFTLKTKGKKRGYVERTETVHSGDLEIRNWNIIPKSKSERKAGDGSQ